MTVTRVPACARASGRNECEDFSESTGSGIYRQVYKEPAPSGLLTSCNSTNLANESCTQLVMSGTKSVSNLYLAMPPTACQDAIHFRVRHDSYVLRAS